VVPLSKVKEAPQEVVTITWAPFRTTTALKVPSLRQSDTVEVWTEPTAWSPPASW